MNEREKVMHRSRYLFSYESPSCSICLQDLSEGVATLNCGHCFHEKCIREYLQTIEKCPFCRCDVPGKHAIPLFYKLTKRQPEQTFNSRQFAQEKFLTELQTIDEYQKAVQKLLDKNKAVSQRKSQYKKRLKQLLSKRNEYIISTTEIRRSVEKQSQKAKKQLKQILLDKEEEIQDLKFQLKCLNDEIEQRQKQSNCSMYCRVKAERDSYKHQLNELCKKMRQEQMVNRVGQMLSSKVSERIPERVESNIDQIVSERIINQYRNNQIGSPAVLNGQIPQVVSNIKQPQLSSSQARGIKKVSSWSCLSCFFSKSD